MTPRSRWVSSVSNLAVVAVIVLAAGCTPLPVKTGSTRYTQGTAKLAAQYQNDLKSLRERLTELEGERREYHRALAESRASQRLLIDQAIASHSSLALAHAQAAFDAKAIELLSDGFDRAFQDVYLRRLKPRLDELSRVKDDADRNARADPQNAATVRQQAIATARLLALRVQAMEDYRLLQLELAGALSTVRSRFISELGTNFPIAALAVSPRTEAFKALLSPKSHEPLPELPSLTADILEREHELAAYSEALNALGTHIDHYLQSDGYRKELVKAFLGAFGDRAKGSLLPFAQQLQSKSIAFLSDKVGLPGLAEKVGAIDTGKLIGKFIDDATGKVAGLVEKGASSAEERINRSLGLQP